MHLKILSLFAAALLLVGCESTGDNMGGTGGEGEVMVEESVTITESPGVQVGSQEELLLQVGDRVFFGYDSSELDAQSQNQLTNMAAWMTARPTVTVTVEGHTDNRGTREYNLALGERRATASRDYLVALGVNPNRIGVVSYGKEKPDVLGDNEQSWAQNRRDFFKVN